MTSVLHETRSWVNVTITAWITNVGQAPTVPNICRQRRMQSTKLLWRQQCLDATGTAYVRSTKLKKPIANVKMKKMLPEI